jgi:hypothetical protein
VAAETLARELSYDGSEAAPSHSAEIEGRELRIGVERV